MPTIPPTAEEGIARHAVSPDSKIKSVSLSFFVKKELYKLIIFFEELHVCFACYADPYQSLPLISPVPSNNL